MKILAKFADSLNFKRVGKGTVFTEFSVSAKRQKTAAGTAVATEMRKAKATRR